MVRWLAKQPPPAGQWQPWFAWHPVKIGATWVWLEWVERQHEFRGYYTLVDYRHLSPPEQEAP